MQTDNRPVSVREQKRLAELEVIISKNFQAFYDVGCALREIRQNRYYRATHATFEDYCRELWDMAEKSANRQIKAADVVDNLKKITDDSLFLNENRTNWSENKPISESESIYQVLPKNEHQARALAKLSPEDQPRVWMEVVKTVPDGGKITASHIKKTIRDMNIASIAEIVDEAVKTDIQKKTDDITIREDRVGMEFRDAFDAFFMQVKKERQNNWRFTEKKVVLRYLEAIYTAVKSEV